MGDKEQPSLTDTVQCYSPKHGYFSIWLGDKEQHSSFVHEKPCLVEAERDLLQCISSLDRSLYSINNIKLYFRCKKMFPCSNSKLFWIHLIMWPLMLLFFLLGHDSTVFYLRLWYSGFAWSSGKLFWVYFQAWSWFDSMLQNSLKEFVVYPLTLHLSVMGILVLQFNLLMCIVLQCIRLFVKVVHIVSANWILCVSTRHGVVLDKPFDIIVISL